jgi:hypothetical protein
VDKEEAEYLQNQAKAQTPDAGRGRVGGAKKPSRWHNPFHKRSQSSDVSRQTSTETSSAETTSTAPDFAQLKKDLIREALTQTTERRFHHNETLQMRMARVITEGLPNQLAYEDSALLNLFRTVLVKQAREKKAGEAEQPQPPVAQPVQQAAAPVAPTPAAAAPASRPDVAAESIAPARRSSRLSTMFTRSKSGNKLTSRSGRIFDAAPSSPALANTSAAHAEEANRPFPFAPMST